MSLFSTHRVLVPIDFSEASFQALQDTLEFVGNPSQVHALHVLSPISPLEPGMIWETLDEGTRLENVRKNFSQRCQGRFEEGINFQVAIGDPSQVIVDYAGAEKVDLIVIPSRGLTGISRFLMGSVAERVVRSSPCPVLVLRR